MILYLRRQATHTPDLSAHIEGKNDERRDSDCSNQCKRNQTVNNLDIRSAILILLAVRAVHMLGFIHI
jgi:hypothetical protein